jgi:hypothetical protein
VLLDMVYGSGTNTAMVALVTARRATAITDRRRGRAATTTARRIHRATPTAATTVRVPAITATDDPAATQSPKRGKLLDGGDALPTVAKAET